ncbi:MAG: hypothetical protein GWP59_01740 [Chlamydiales bacterium]|nr:hypothetical protein [Chlamydiales bacterium]
MKSSKLYLLSLVFSVFSFAALTTAQANTSRPVAERSKNFNIQEESLKKPTVVSDKKYQELFMPLEHSSFFSTENSCSIKRLEPNTWLLSSPQHLFINKASIFLADFPKTRGLALYRLESLNNNYLWPLFWEKAQDLPQKTLLILWQENPSTYGAIAPVLGKDALVELRSDAHKLFADISTGVSYAQEQLIPLAIAGFDSNPYRLIEKVLNQAKNHSPFPPQVVNKKPKWLEYLGWSSEKVFQTPLTNKDFLNFLIEMEKEKYPFGFFLLDSPWQEINEQNQLEGLNFNTSLLMGLKPLVNEAKARVGVKSVGVSHSIFGTSQGVDPHSSLGKEYQLLPQGLVHPSDYKRFIHHLHAPLQDAGADFLLVKDMSKVLSSLHNHLPPVSGNKTILDLFKESYQKTFDSGFIADHAHNTISLYYANKEDVIRTASPAKSGLQQNLHHVLYQSAYSSLAIASLATPDWGSFSTSRKDAWSQAAARVISGGPVYINDAVEHIDRHLISAIALPEGQVFKWDHFARPTRSSLFFDPIKDQPLMLFNSQGDSKTLGIFNLKGQDTGYLIGPQDVDLTAEEGELIYALFSYKEGYLGKVNVKDWIQRKIKGNDWDIVTFSPVKNGVAVIGNPQSLNPYGWMETTEWKDQENLSQLNIKAKAKGTILLVTYKHPYAVYHQGVKLPFNWDGKVIEIEVPQGPGSLDLEVFFFKKAN